MTKPQEKILKTCIVCGKIAPMTAAQDKCSAECKKIFWANYQRDWKVKNHDKVLAFARKHRLDNLEKVRAYDREYKAMLYEKPSFRKKVVKRVKKYRRENPDKARASCRECSARNKEQRLLSRRASNKLSYHGAVNIVRKKDVKIYVRPCSLGWYYEVYKQLHLPRIYRSPAFDTFDQAKKDALDGYL